MNSGEYLDRILEEFSRIATIPRPSHHEKQIGAYLCDWAQRHNLPYILDELGHGYGLRGRKRYIVQSP